MIENYQKEVTKFFEKPDMKLTWATGLSYHKNSTTTKFHFDSMAIAKTKSIPLLDLYSMSDVCQWSNCSADGGHRSRFVNRMKVQMFLNNLCEVNV